MASLIRNFVKVNVLLGTSGGRTEQRKGSVVREFIRSGGVADVTIGAKRWRWEEDHERSRERGDWVHRFDPGP
jgi:hypothetical protein